MPKLPRLLQELRGRTAPAMDRLHSTLGRLQSPDRWPGWDWGPLAALEPSSRALAVAIAFSIVLHAVVLVNSKSRSRPAKADVHAQANLDGGGNTDENRRAKTPLPVLPSAKPGND